MNITELKYKLARLQLKSPFAIAHGTTEWRESIIVELVSENRVGFGEAAVVPYYRETKESIIHGLDGARRLLMGMEIDDRGSPKQLQIEQFVENTATRCALDIALWDLFGKAKNATVSELVRAPGGGVASSFTVAMDRDIENYRKKLAAVSDWPLLKLKLGSGSLEHDMRLVETAKKEVDAGICVDVNGGWTVDDAVWAIPRIADERTMYVEQPIGPGRTEWEDLRKRLPESMPPIIADESFQNISDISELRGFADGVNIKLRKLGGLTSAHAGVLAARKAGLKVMIGCMIETSISVSAAAGLAPLADYVDLDASLLIRNDPFTGVSVKMGTLCFPDRFGHGAIPR